MTDPHQPPRGAVAAGSKATVRVAGDVLSAGGNAADAAVAGLLTSLVSEAIYTNLGAGAIIVVREPGGRVHALDAFAAVPGLGAPADARDRMDFREKRILYGRTELSFHVGRASVAVPGMPAGIATLHDRFASVPLPELAAPAVALARAGVTWPPRHRELIEVLGPILTDTDACRDLLLLDDGRPLGAERQVRMLELADLLELLAVEGFNSFYRGAAAQCLLADQQARGGLITELDLERYEVLRAPPVRVRLAGWDAWLPGPPSLGGTMVAAMLALWGELADRQDPPPHGSADGAHRWAVVIAAVNGARPAIERAADRPGALMRQVRELVEPALEAIDTYTPPIGLEDPKVTHGTTHLSVIDSDGMAVSISSSAGESAGFVVPGLGTMMNNMLGEADLHHGGFHRAPPGTRLPTMMAPMLLMRADRPGPPGHVVAMGSGGSLRIRTALSQVAWSLVGRREQLADAIEAPRWHFEEGILHLEATPDDAPLARTLRDRGYRVTTWDDRSGYFGGVHAASLRAHGGRLHATAHGDSRRAGAGAAVT